MSIQSEINRIKSNMSDALAATAEMGADVPATASSDDLGTLIRAIPKVSVVQTTGDSTTDVMSQAAVTNAMDYAMPKYNEGIPTYQNNTELAGRIYCVDIPDIPTLKHGMELTIIPHATSVTDNAYLSINNGESIRMRVTSGITDAADVGITTDYITAGGAVKLMYTQNTLEEAAYAVLSNGKVVSMRERGAWANGYAIIIWDSSIGTVFTIYDASGNEVESYKAGEKYNGITDANVSTSFGAAGTYYFSNGTDATITPFWKITSAVRTRFIAETMRTNNTLGEGLYPSTPKEVGGRLNWNTPSKVGLDINKNSVYPAQSTDGVNYTADIPDLDAYYDGLEVTIVPKKTSTSKNAKLSINSLDAKQIYYTSSGKTSGYISAKTDDFLASGVAVTLTYSQNLWRINRSIPRAEYLHGEVPVKGGGTGRATLTSGYYLVGNGTSAVTLRSKAQVLSDIGAASASTVASLLAKIEELTERVEALEAGGGGTITFYYDDGNTTRTLSADEGMTWGDFIESDYNPEVECQCCGGGSRLIDSFENISGGDSGDGEVVGFCYDESPSCAYGNYSGELLVCCEEEGDLRFVGLNETIESGRTYYNLYALT